MRVHRIVLLIFAFAFLAQGKSLPSTFSEEANVPIALPLVSINNGYQGIADDFNDDSSENIGEAPPKRPPISQEQTQSNGDKADGLKELKKEFKHGRLNLKHLNKKLAPLLKTSDIQHTGSNIKPTTKSSQQPKKSKNEKQNPSKKSEKTKMDRKSGSGELSHLNLKGLFKKLAPLFKTSPSNKKSGKSHIPLTGMNIPVGKQLFGSMKKPLPHKSSLVHKKSGKPNPKQERPFLVEDIDLEEANMDSETGSGESYRDMFESEEPNNVVGPQLRTGKTGEPNAFGRENTEKTHAPDVNNPRRSLKSDSQLTGTDIPVNMQGFGSIEKALPTLSSLLKKHWPIQNLKRERSSLDKEVDSEEVMDSESGSGESSSKTPSNVWTPPQLGSGDSGAIFSILTPGVT
ncbi:uncharacterized protein LOC111342223 [Stylophora pistillata]|uniref:uncharacterized protein LOC111342223 n=1 Tax=Stylophora pistillata TaxID=50429 RepID=UPI000C04F031|nr:uncharacterized protein LOC111342223 [Stylophora pistillata]